MKTLFDHPVYPFKPTDGSLEDSLRAVEVLHPQKISADNYQDLMDIKRAREKRDRERGPLFFFIGLSLSLLLVTIAFNWKSYDNADIVDLGQVDNTFDEMLEVPVSTQPPPPPPKKMEVLNIQVVDDEQIIEEVEINLDVELTEEMAVADVVYEDIPIEEVEEKADEIFQVVEDHPTFPGGIGQFYQYVAENITYPESARRLNVSGRVFVRFVIEKDGKPTQVHVVKGIGAGCDEEAVRVIENSPAWNPGKQRGHPVRVYMTVPINFTLRLE